MSEASDASPAHGRGEPFATLPGWGRTPIRRPKSDGPLPLWELLATGRPHIDRLRIRRARAHLEIPTALHHLFEPVEHPVGTGVVVSLLPPALVLRRLVGRDP